MEQLAYEQRLQTERILYDSCEDVHRLPEIFHYWSNHLIRPQIEAFGFHSPENMFLKYLRAQKGGRFVSIGSGNCDLELECAAGLTAAGREDFTIDCIDINPVMLERGRIAAEERGLSGRLNFVEADFNHWNPAGEYDAVLANQSLHHVVELEALLDQVSACLRHGGRFVISDMIGRNGHRRWPAALGMIWNLWRDLPASYRYNLKSRCYEEWYEDRDYSAVGFEGIRAEDILPLLAERFEFEMFFGFANVIDPFVDRAFGAHFDPERDWDRAFIDKVHALDRTSIEGGAIPPTHMFCALRKHGTSGPREWNVAPDLCLKARNAATRFAVQPVDAYSDESRRLDPKQELEAACMRLAESARVISGKNEDIARLDAEVHEQSAWALRLDREIATQNERITGLQAEGETAQRWTDDLQLELNVAHGHVLRLERELSERTEWAQNLNGQLAERTEWALSLKRDLDESEAEPLWRRLLRRGLKPL